jgi:hypothetical protein
MLHKTSANTPWTDAELADTVDAYVFMLSAQAVGIVYRKETAANALLEEGLPDRNAASLRYRCQTARKRDPLWAPKRDPFFTVFERRGA